jgi:hypothetical protein
VVLAVVVAVAVEVITILKLQVASLKHCGHVTTFTVLYAVVRQPSSLSVDAVCNSDAMQSHTTDIKLL